MISHMNQNIYENASDPPKMIDSFVCYADILGYSQLCREALKSEQGDDFLRKLRNALSSVYFNIRERLNSRSQRFFSMKVFTDNIVIGFPLHDPDFEQGWPELADILDIFKELQFTLAIHGFFVRGGITRGLHYMDDDIVFGDALLNAVAFDKKGGPPRIMLDSYVVKTIFDQMDSMYSHVKYVDDILIDADGKYYLNYLGEAYRFYPQGGIFTELIEEHKQQIIFSLKKYRAVPDIRTKYEWVARYHNFVCQNFAERNQIPSDPDAEEVNALAAVEAQSLLEHLIDLESLIAGPTSIK